MSRRNMGQVVFVFFCFALSFSIEVMAAAVRLRFVVLASMIICLVLPLHFSKWKKRRKGMPMKPSPYTFFLILAWSGNEFQEQKQKYWCPSIIVHSTAQDIEPKVGSQARRMSQPWAWGYAVARHWSIAGGKRKVIEQKVASMLLD
jgi:hypothetical protein